MLRDGSAMSDAGQPRPSLDSLEGVRGGDPTAGDMVMSRRRRVRVLVIVGAIQTAQSMTLALVLGDMLRNSGPVLGLIAFLSESLTAAWGVLYNAAVNNNIVLFELLMGIPLIIGLYLVYFSGPLLIACAIGTSRSKQEDGGAPFRMALGIFWAWIVSSTIGAAVWVVGRIVESDLGRPGAFANGFLIALGVVAPLVGLWRVRRLRSGQQDRFHSR